MKKFGIVLASAGLLAVAVPAPASAQGIYETAKCIALAETPQQTVGCTRLVP
jgi:hypothetical protein